MTVNCFDLLDSGDGFISEHHFFDSHFNTQIKHEMAEENVTVYGLVFEWSCCWCCHVDCHKIMTQTLTERVKAVTEICKL